MKSRHTQKAEAAERLLPLLNNMQVKLMLLFFVFALVPFCAVGILSIRTAEDLVLNMAANQVEHVVVDKTALLERWVSERKADLEVITGSSVLRSMDPRQMASYLELVRNKYKVYDEISVVSRSGAVIHRSSGRDARFKLEEEGAPFEIDGFYMSDIRLSPNHRDSYFWIAAPLFGPSGTVEGTVRASVGTGTILSVILRVSLGETGECYLVNGDGTFLAHKDPGRILTENIAQSESYKNIFGTKARGVIYTDYRGIEVIGASRMVGGTDWALVVEQDRAEAFRTVDGIRRHIFMVIVFSLCGTLLSAWLLSRHVATPIRKLGQAANALARGEFEKVNIVRSDRGDEVGILSRAFGEMARQLEDRQHTLEEKVIRREVELHATDVRLKATEEAAARSQQLASLGQLAAGVAHEIRTPLTSLKMFLEAIESELEIAEEYEEDFRVAARQIARMEATIHRFLDFARPEDPVLTEVDVRDLIEDALLVVGPRAKQQETVLQTHIEEDLPPIRADRKQLGEALLNLMVNGLEAMGSRGLVTVTACREAVSWESGARECVRIDVADTGTGISEAIRPQLFDPFFTTKATGTGLGLSTVQSSLQRLGGKVSVESIVGRGSTFSLFIPIEHEGMPGEDGKNTGS
ncbi:ATP-binding protein [Desulforhabdus sp. TSK]|uniref:ATP-binding protein n=1 Tax=Desulforhabdus sp. TSK TaxID=2925014 RepID=UPI001FC8BC91|nr:ATP-binding protein [Desulforhabdus sp. TSK]GKT09466.1 hypothetical protein DSTSK_27710 [Desulforhabdus sp. TSK]